MIMINTIKKILMLIMLTISMMACTHPVAPKLSESKVILTEDSLSNDKKYLLNSLKTQWLSTKGFDCLAASGIRPDCDDQDAGGIALGFILCIDTSGKVTQVEITKAEVCGADREKMRDIKKCFIENLALVIFPSGLRDMKLKFALRHSVKS